jgi:hypothetical protein
MPQCTPSTTKIKKYKERKKLGEKKSVHWPNCRLGPAERFNELKDVFKEIVLNIAQKKKRWKTIEKA